ncbi:MAG: hypothetical protein ACM3SP_21160, partial [Chloroflexota bacterium]
GKIKHAAQESEQHRMQGGFSPGFHNQRVVLSASKEKSPLEKMTARSIERPLTERFRRSVQTEGKG